MKTLMFKIPLMLGLCLASISGNAQSWQSAAPDILYGVNNLSLTVPIRVGIGTAVPVAPLHVQNGCVLFDGNTGSTPVSGTGTRMMWVPDKAAFRAGYVVGSEWDNVNIGLYSSAFNSTTTASGESAFAANIETEATGDGSFAANGYTKASNMYAAAFGDGSTASGIASFAMGIIQQHQVLIRLPAVLIQLLPEMLLQPSIIPRRPQATELLLPTQLGQMVTTLLPWGKLKLPARRRLPGGIQVYWQVGIILLHMVLQR